MSIKVIIAYKSAEMNRAHNENSGNKFDAWWRDGWVDVKVKPFHVKHIYEMIQSEIIWLKRRFVCKMTIPHTHTVWHKSTSELLKWIKAYTHARTNDVNRYTKHTIGEGRMREMSEEFYHKQQELIVRI